MPKTVDVRRAFDWLVDGAPGAPRPDLVVARLGGLLGEAGVPVERISAMVRTLHPHVLGRLFLWRADGLPCAVHELPYVLLDSPEIANTPFGRVHASGAELRVRLDGSESLEDLGSDVAELRRQGLTDYVALPICFLDGQRHAISFATRAANGFHEEHLDALRAIARPLARLAEIMALRRTAANLLSAYVGRDAGERILQGRVQRGDTETIRCAIWFSDLRGFTSLSNDRKPEEIIRLLNDVFDCQVAAVERHGGEVLKFMGDGMLAIFPLGAGGSTGGGAAMANACEEALAAARESFAALELLNTTRSSRGETALSFGVSLHLGEVAYGNIGGAARLDFTCIGSAVNLAARLEGLTAPLGRPLVVSEAFAIAARSPMRRLGEFALKGIAGVAMVFEPEG